MFTSDIKRPSNDRYFIIRASGFLRGETTSRLKNETALANLRMTSARSSEGTYEPFKKVLTYPRPAPPKKKDASRSTRVLH